jgi:hypothetical protein
MAKMKKILILIGFCFLFILFPLAVQAEPVGKFTHIEGGVDITSPGQMARPAHLGDEVSVGDDVRSKSRSKAEITFIDGNILRLAKSTRVKINEYLFDKEQNSAIIRLFRGKIQNRVKRVLGRVFGFKKRNRFEVHTPTAVVGVRGTDFFTYHMRDISGAKFKVNRWDNNKWGANITDGIGILNRTDVEGTVNITFKGGAAGAYTGTISGDFSGTGTGVVNSQ